MSMSGDSYISDHKLNEIREEYGDRVVSFSSVEQEIKGWYQDFGFQYPASSINNYRDSWFHYRKIWTERSLYEVICQMATFDEHLQRAEKDAIVNFFQSVSQKLEFWYRIDCIMIPEIYEKQIEQDTQILYGNSTSGEKEDGMWLYSLWSSYGEEEQKASFALIYAVQKYFISREESRCQIQKVLHLIKNTTLMIRFEASDIRRIEKPGEYLERFRAVYDRIHNFFWSNKGLFFLLGISNVVKTNIVSWQIEQEAV